MDLGMKNGVLFADDTYDIVGAAMEVYNEMGAGFLESVYQECLEIELGRRNIPFSAQEKIRLNYKGTPLKSTHFPDLICHEKIVIELKSTKSISREHQAQIYNYLKASELTLGLIINFGAVPNLEHQRIPFTIK